MLLTILVLVVIVAVVVSGSFNPFIWVRTIISWCAVVVGWSPKTLEYSKELGKELKADAEVQFAKEGNYQERTFKVVKERASQNAARFFDPKIEEAKANQARLTSELADLLK